MEEAQERLTCALPEVAERPEGTGGTEVLPPPLPGVLVEEAQPTSEATDSAQKKDWNSLARLRVSMTWISWAVAAVSWVERRLGEAAKANKLTGGTVRRSGHKDGPSKKTESL